MTPEERAAFDRDGYLVTRVHWLKEQGFLNPANPP
jgi:hypothetical protein